MPEPEENKCSVCTYLNQNVDAVVCEMCQTPFDKKEPEKINAFDQSES